MGPWTLQVLDHLSSDTELFIAECPCYLLLGKEVLDQGPHNLLWRPGGADVRDDGVPVGLLSIADPA